MVNGNNNGNRAILERELMILGVGVRLKALDAERDYLMKTFNIAPDVHSLHTGARKTSRTPTPARRGMTAVRKATPTAKRSTMSKAMRKAVSLRMKMYWAGRRRDAARAEKAASA